jgi:hypothetical protein
MNPTPTKLQSTIRTAATVAAIALLALGALPAPASAQTGSPPAVDAGSPLAQRAAEDYRREARYPDHSRALEAGRPDPVRAKHTPTRHSLAGPDGAPPRLSVWSEQVSFQAPEPVDLFATLQGPGRHEAVITGEVEDARGNPVGTVTYLDDGVAPDARAGDGVYSARFELPGEAVPELAEAFLVKVYAGLDDGDSRRVAAGFLYTSPWAELTGRFRDRVVDGDLVVSAQVEVERAGRFHLEGALHTMSGEPVGWAQTALELEPGVHWVDLSFYGLMFRDRGASGPLRLGTVALTTTGAMPNGLGEPLVDAYTTRPVRAERMRAEPFARPDLLQAAERLEGRAGSR